MSSGILAAHDGRTVMRLNTLYLAKDYMGAQVRHNVTLLGQPNGQPRVTALVLRKGDLGWCLLADAPDNPGVSVTNGVENYAEAVCHALECERSDLVWFELDSTGAFDQLEVLGGRAGFTPVNEAGFAPRSQEAFLARARRVFGAALPRAFVDAVIVCSDRFQP